MVKIVCIDGRNIAHSTSGGKLDWSNLIIVVEALVLSKFGEIHLFIPFWARGQIPADLFMILEEISGIKIEISIDNLQFNGYPLVIKKNWSVYLFILYLVIFPLMMLFLYYKKRRKKNEK